MVRSRQYSVLSLELEKLSPRATSALGNIIHGHRPESYNPRFIESYPGPGAGHSLPRAGLRTELLEPSLHRIGHVDLIPLSLHGYPHACGEVHLTCRIGQTAIEVSQWVIGWDQKPHTQREVSGVSNGGDIEVVTLID